MKLKKILAAVAAAAVAVSSMAVSAFAADVWTGSSDLGTAWDGSKAVTIDGANFADTKDGDTVVISYTTGDAEYFQLKICENANNWAPLESPTGVDPQWGTVTVEKDTTSFSFNISAADVAKVQATGMVIAGYGVTITGVAVDGAAPAAEAETAPAAASYDVKTVMVMQENATWTNNKSAEVAVTGEGEYTYSLSGLSIDPTTATVLYIKDAACVDETPSGYQSNISDISLEYKSLKINGADVTISGDAPTAIKDGVFDFCLYNIWADNYIDLPTDTITSVELTVAISSAAAAPVEETATAEAPVEDEADEDADEPEEVEDEAEEPAEEPAPAETEAPAVEEAPAPAVENATAAPATGNTAAASIVAVMAVAGVAAIAAKKRK